MNKNKANEFINKVFNYYNGKINTIVPAKLIIKWNYMDNRTAIADTSSPNIIYVYPEKCYNISDKSEYDFYVIIVEAIIHELFHVDQVIDRYRSNYDMDYRQQIETAVEYQVVSYIMNNKDEIFEQFGIDLISVSDEIFKKTLEKIGKVKYERRTYVTHLSCILSEFLGGCFDDYEILLNTIESFMNYKHGLLIISIDNTELKVQDDDNFISIDEINNFFYNNCFYKSMLPAMKINVDIETDSKIYIKIQKQPIEGEEIL